MWTFSPQEAYLGDTLMCRNDFVPLEILEVRPIPRFLATTFPSRVFRGVYPSLSSTGIEQAVRGSR